MSTLATLAPLGTLSPNIPITTIGPTTNIFSQSGVVLVFWFLAIYFIIYFVLGIFFNKGSNGSTGEANPLRIVRILDGIIFLFVLLFLISTMASSKTEDIGPKLSNALSSFKEFGDNPYSIFSIIVFIAVFYGIIYLIRLPMDSASKPVSIMLIETIAILLFVVVLILDFFKYILKIDLLSLLMDWLIDWLKGPEPTPIPTTSAPDKTTKPRDSSGNEVFNIRNNLYTYDEAKSVCSIYGATVASYDQVEESYNDGGEWCNYGWSDGQMALFPTQKDTWNKLQKTDRAKNACGRPGINGGYIKNKNVRLGVNCYGRKPKPTANEKALMSANIEDKLPESAADRALRTKMDIWKKNADKYLIVNSFNKKEWSDFSS
jgi:Extracellular link domain